MVQTWSYIGNRRLGLVAPAGAVGGFMATGNIRLIVVGITVILLAVITTSLSLWGDVQTGKPPSARFRAAQAALLTALTLGTYTLAKGDSTCFWTFGATAAGVYFFDRSNMGDAHLIALFTVAGSLVATTIVQCLRYGCEPDAGQIAQFPLWIGGGLIMLSAKGLEIAWVMRHGGTIGTPDN